MTNQKITTDLPKIKIIKNTSDFSINEKSKSIEFRDAVIQSNYNQLSFKNKIVLYNLVRSKMVKPQSKYHK